MPRCLSHIFGMHHCLRILSLSILLACSDDAAVGEPISNPRVLILTQPGDLTSGLGNLPVRIILQPWVRSYVTSEMLEEVRTLVFAESEGQRLALEIELEIDNAADSPDPEADANYPSSLLIVPIAGVWPETWVNLRVGPLPEYLNPHYARVVDNHLTTRFTTESRPLIKAFELCPKPTGIIRFMVHFSEPIVDDDADDHLHVSLDGVKCYALPQPANSPTITIECSDIATDRRFSLTMLPGLRSESGVLVTTFDGEDTVETSGLYDDLQATQEGCRGADLSELTK